MDRRSRLVAAGLGAVTFFLVVQFCALALVEPFDAAGYQSVDDPQNPLNSAIYLGVILVATAVMLALMRYDLTRVLRAFLVLTSGLIAGYVFSVTVPPVRVAALGGLDVAPWVGAGVVVLGLVVYPEWWVIDGAGLLMGMGAGALFGISFGILPAIILLTALAVYDAISVYGTKHMLTLASGVMELRVPVLIIIPTTRGYSFIEEASEMASSIDAETSGDADAGDADGATTPDAGADEPLARDAFFIGLGDAVMPSIMVASAGFFLETPRILGVEMAPLFAIGGTTVGLLVLLWMVAKGRAHAGLPLLNGGAIGGYLLGALAAGIPLISALGLNGLF
ncbi:MAG: presenilin family intramembrane aspartyl protease PSH [Halanaeroarchaeum sp.]